jgi:hypothetical protein
MAIEWLADVLRQAGVAVSETNGWQTRGVSGDFAPIGVLWHHTAATSSASDPAPSLDIVINGRPDLEGPLCHALVDYHGVFHVVAANRANHAGEARASGPIPAGDGNTMLIGWEIDYNGTDQAMTPAQYSASVRATAAVLSRLGRDAGFARGHLETSTTGKIDPAFVNLDRMRQDVAAALSGGGGGVGPMYHRVRRADGTWTGFTPIAGFGTTQPGDARDMAIAGLPNGTAQLLIIGADWRVYHQSRGTSGIWSGFETVAGFGTTAPAAGSRVGIAGLPDGSTQIVIIGADNGVYHQIRSALGTWSGFQPLPGLGTPSTAQARDVAIAGLPDGSSQALIIGADGRVYHQRRSATGAWSGFQPVAGQGTTEPAAGSRVAIAGASDGSAHVLIAGAGNVVYHQLRRPDGSWSGFQPLPGFGTPAPAQARDVAVTALVDGTAQVAIVGADEGVYHQVRRADGSWTGFQPVAGAGTPATALADVVSLGSTLDGAAQLVIVGRR